MQAAAAISPLPASVVNTGARGEPDLGGVIVSEDAVEAVHGTFGQPAPGTEEQQAVSPGQVVPAAPMTLGLLRDALADLGDHQMET